jgi:hypothetical protein
MVPRLVYYETIKRDLNRRVTKLDMSVGEMKDEKTKLRDLHVSYTLCREGLEHLKIETRLIDQRFACVMGECVILTLKVCRLYST